MPELLDFKAKVDFTQARRDLEDFQKMLANVGVAPAMTNNEKAFSTKPLTEYQKGLLKIKQDTLDLAKAKQESINADRNASLATQEALKNERLLREEALTQIAKNKLALQEQIIAQKALNAEQARSRPGTIVSPSDPNSQFLNSTVRSDSIINAERVERAQLNTVLARQAVAEGTLTSAMNSTSAATSELNRQTTTTNLTRRQTAQLIADERYIQAQNTRELRNNSREQLNAKGSLEQRRAALIRLTSTYDRLSVAERASPSGQRLGNIVTGLTTQVQTLEVATLRAQRNVGNYGSAFTRGLSGAWSWIRKIAYILPGVGIAGLLAFATEPILNYIKSLDLFKNKIDENKASKDAFNSVNVKGAKDAQFEITQLKTLYKATQDTTLSLKQRNSVVNEIQKKYPEYFGNLKNETILAGNASGAYDRLRESLIATAKARASEQKIAENSSRQLDNEQKILDLEIELKKNITDRTIAQERLNKLNKESGDRETAGLRGDASLTVSTLTDKIRDTSKQIRDLKKDTLILNQRNLRLEQNITDQQKAGAEIVKTDVKNNSSVQNAALKDAESFSQKLTDLHNASVRKQMNSDDAEIQSVKDKYAKMKIEADKYYADPKHNGVVKINGINVSKSQVYGGLKTDQQTEIDAINKARQDKIDQDEHDKAQKHYEQLLKDFMDYGQKRDAITKAYEEDALILINDPRQLAQRKKAYENDLKELDDANVKKLSSYEELFVGIDDLSKRSALKVLDKARDQFTKDKLAGIVDPKDIPAIEALFNRIGKSIRNGTGAALIDIVNQIDNIVSAVGGVDTAFGKVLSTVSNVIGQVGNIKKGMSDFTKAQDEGDTLGQLGAGLGILGAGISIFKSVFSLFDRSAKREEQAIYANDRQQKQNDALSKSLQRQIELVDEAYGTDRIEKYNEAVLQATENEKKYQDQLSGRITITGNKSVDDYITKINNGEELNPIYKNIVNNLINKGVIKQIGDLSKLTVQQLSDLKEGGSVDEGTSNLLQNLIDAKQAVIDLNNSLIAERVGSTLSQIADDFITTLTDGTQDFGKSFEDTIRTSILNGFKGELIRTQLQAFYTEFADLSKDGLTKDEISTLRDTYNAAAEKAKKDIEDLSKATGIDLTDKSKQTSTNSLSGSIQKELTEQTGTIIASNFNGMRLSLNNIEGLLKPVGKSMGDLYDIARANFDAVLRIEENTRRTANNTDKLPSIEEKLITISKNTGDSLSTQLRAAGKFGY